MSKPRATYRPMTAEEKDRAIALGDCKFPTASFSKRFAREICHQAQTRGEITEKQAARLAIQAYIYRRQMAPGTAPAAQPPGYMTPKQRSQAARLEYERARAAAAPQPAKAPSRL